MNKELLLEKYIKVAVRKALKEQEEQQRKAEKAMYLIYRFPGLKKLMTDLMSPAFGRYVSGVNVVAPDIDPEPLCVHNIVPFVELAPDTVAVPFEHIVWLPPATAVGNGFTVTE